MKRGWEPNEEVISIIVPNLNEEKVLPYFLTSLAKQGPGYELIVVDGGSTDRSREIIDCYRDRIQITGLIDETRNLGYIRNKGARAARGRILFFTNSDAVLAKKLLPRISFIFNSNENILALSGKTKPWNGGLLCNAGYVCFDLIRAFMANHLDKFSPSGNFLAVRSEMFWKIGGFPEIPVNEDGELGQKISQFCKSNGKKARFDLDLSTGHFVKRWKNPVQALSFYLYVFGNFHPFLKKILKPFEQKAGEIFRK